jgi:hypothetical protein
VLADAGQRAGRLEAPPLFGQQGPLLDALLGVEDLVGEAALQPLQARRAVRVGAQGPP